jgi:predicted RND superfamily exporter protein
VIARIVTGVLSRPLLSVLVMLVVLAVALVGATRMRLDFSSTSFYGGDDEAVAKLAAYQERWGADDDVILVVAQASEGDVLTRSRLGAIARLGERLEQLDEVVDVQSVAKVSLPGGASLLDTAPENEAARQAWKPLVLERAPVVPVLLSEDAEVTALAVEMKTSSDDLAAVVPAVEQIEQVVADAGQEAGLSLSLAGIPAVRAGFFRLTLRDQMVLQPIMVVMIGLGLLVVFRRVHGVVAPGLAAGLPVLMLVGCMGWLGEPVGLINQAYFTLIPVLAVADAVHLVARFHEEAREGGLGKDAIVRATSHVGLACLLTTLTTAAGFSSLAVARMPILRHFGLFAALGIVFAYAVVLTVVPLVLRTARAKPPARTTGSTLARRLGTFAVGRPWVVIAGAAVVCVGMGVAGSRVVVDNRLTDLLEPEHPAHRASDVVDARLGGILSLELDLAAAPGTFEDPEVLAALRELEREAQEEPDVRAVLGPGGLSRWLDLDALGAWVDDERAHARMSVRVAEPGGRAFEALADRMAARCEASLAPLGIHAEVTGTTLVAYRGVNRITGDLRASLSLVFAVVTILIFGLFRSSRLALISLVPNAMPLLVGYGCVALFGWTLDPIAAVVLSLALGIAVDDTIHVLVRTREGLRAGLALPEATVEALTQSGRAVLVTSLLVSAGLAINLLSSFPPLQMLGVLGAIVMMTALVCDLLLLPALLVVFGPRGRSVSHDAAGVTRMS